MPTEIAEPETAHRTEAFLQSTSDHFLEIMEVYAVRMANRRLPVHRRYYGVERDDLQQEARFALMEVWSKYGAKKALSELCKIANRAIHFHLSNLLEKEIRKRTLHGDYRVRERTRELARGAGTTACPGCGAHRKDGKCKNLCATDARSSAVKRLRAAPDVVPVPCPRSGSRGRLVRVAGVWKRKKDPGCKGQVVQQRDGLWACQVCTWSDTVAPSGPWNEAKLRSLVVVADDGREVTMDFSADRGLSQAVSVSPLDRLLELDAERDEEMVITELRQASRQNALAEARYSDPLASVIIREETERDLLRAAVRDNTMTRWRHDVREGLHNGGYISQSSDTTIKENDSDMEIMEPDANTQQAAPVQPEATATKPKRARKPAAAKAAKPAKAKKAAKVKAEKKPRTSRAKGELDAESAKAVAAFKKGDAVSYLGGAKVDKWLGRGAHMSVIGTIVNRGRSFVRTRVTGGKTTVLAPRFIEKI